MHKPCILQAEMRWQAAAIGKAFRTEQLLCLGAVFPGLKIHPAPGLFREQGRLVVATHRPAAPIAHTPDDLVGIGPIADHVAETTAASGECKAMSAQTASNASRLP